MEDEDAYKSKYLRLGVEFKKLREKYMALQTVLQDSRTELSQTQSNLRDKEIECRKMSGEQESLSYRNALLTKQISHLRVELENSSKQHKDTTRLNKSATPSNQANNLANNLTAANNEGGDSSSLQQILQEELQKRIREIGELNQQIVEMSGQNEAVLGRIREEKLELEVKLEARQSELSRLQDSCQAESRRFHEASHALQLENSSLQRKLDAAIKAREDTNQRERQTAVPPNGNAEHTASSELEEEDLLEATSVNSAFKLSLDKLSPSMISESEQQEQPQQQQEQQGGTLLAPPHSSTSPTVAMRLAQHLEQRVEQLEREKFELALDNEIKEIRLAQLLTQQQQQQQSSSTTNHQENERSEDHATTNKNDDVTREERRDDDKIEWNSSSSEMEALIRAHYLQKIRSLSGRLCKTTSKCTYLRCQIVQLEQTVDEERQSGAQLRNEAGVREAELEALRADLALHHAQYNQKIGELSENLAAVLSSSSSIVSGGGDRYELEQEKQQRLWDPSTTATKNSLLDPRSLNASTASSSSTFSSENANTHQSATSTMRNLFSTKKKPPPQV